MPDHVPTAPALKVGDRIKDNDPRMPNRVMTVTAIKTGEGKAVVSERPGDRTHETRISLARIHLDGKPRRTGWSVVR